MSRTRTIVLVSAGALILAAGAAAGLALTRTADLVATADGFFRSVKARDAAAARAFLSRAFAPDAGDEELLAALEASGLAGVRSASWSSRSVALGGGRGELAGSVETEDGRSIPVRLTLVQEDGAWTIYALARPPPAAAGPPPSDRLPAAAELLALVRAGVHALAVSRRDGDFTPFWDAMSTLWQSSTSVAEIGGVFGVAGALRGDLAALDPRTPAIVGTPALEDGVLTVQVRYELPGEPPVFVRGRYVHERSAWRLVGFSVGGTQEDG